MSMEDWELASDALSEMGMKREQRRKNGGSHVNMPTSDEVFEMLGYLVRSVGELSRRERRQKWAIERAIKIADKALAAVHTQAPLERVINCELTAVVTTLAKAVRELGGGETDG